MKREKPANGSSVLSTHGSELRAGLVKAIVTGLRAARPRSPVYALAIYRVGSEPERALPPRVAYATEANAQHFRRLRLPNLPTMAWSPTRWVGSGVDQIVKLRLAPPLAKLCVAASEEVAPHLREAFFSNLQKTEPRLHESLVVHLGAPPTPASPALAGHFAALLDGIAADLGAADLPIPRSRGFVVYGLGQGEPDAADAARSAAAAVGAQARPTLERRGLLAPVDGAAAADYPRALLESAAGDAGARVAALEALGEDERAELEFAGLMDADIEEGRRILRWCAAAPAVGEPDADRLEKLRFLRLWLEGWDDTLRSVLTDADAREKVLGRG